MIINNKKNKYQHKNKIVKMNNKKNKDNNLMHQNYYYQKLNCKKLIIK